MTSLYDIARQNGETFAGAALRVREQPSLVPSLGQRISQEMKAIQEVVDAHRDRFALLSEESESDDLSEALIILAENTIAEATARTLVLRYLEPVVSQSRCATHIELLRALSSSREEEQEIDLDSVNMMTMHKAKGLTANAVIITACEDEYVPGAQANGDKEGDERRLLYVSLTRARHFLAMTYCEGRVGTQRHTGRNRGKMKRTLTRFLRDAQIVPVDGETYIRQLPEEATVGS